MLLSSAGWSDDEDEEKEELITSEIEKFRQKQVHLILGRGWGARERENAREVTHGYIYLSANFKERVPCGETLGVKYCGCSDATIVITTQNA